MIDGGVLIMLVSVMILFTPRGYSAQPVRRPATIIIASAALRTAYPPATPTPQLTALVARADEALEQDSLTRGVRGIAATYDRT